MVICFFISDGNEANRGTQTDGWKWQASAGLFRLALCLVGGGSRQQTMPLGWFGRLQGGRSIHNYNRIYVIYIYICIYICIYTYTYHISPQQKQDGLSCQSLGKLMQPTSSVLFLALSPVTSARSSIRLGDLVCAHDDLGCSNWLKDVGKTWIKSSPPQTPVLDSTSPQLFTADESESDWEEEPERPQGALTGETVTRMSI